MLGSMLSKVKYAKLIHYLSTDGQLDGIKIKNLLIGDITELTRAVSSIGKIEGEKEEEGFHKLYKNFTDRKLGKEWAEKIGVTICPYCNRSYIYTLKKSGIRPQYDHYFPKSRYPYLALSMYNLIPCCAICNGAKQDFDTFNSATGEENFIYPFRDAYRTEIFFQTSCKGNMDVWLGSSGRFELKIETAGIVDPKLKKRGEEAQKQLKLNELYGKHKDYVQDIIRTTYIYNKAYFEGLADSFPMIFNSEQEAENLIYMNYLDEENWDKRILAKLTYDIKKEYQA